MKTKNKDFEYMQLAIKQAKIAYKLEEIPVGAVIVNENKIISVGFNKREKSNNALAHAEIVAINSACKKLKSWRLLDSTIYVTLEPCLMCAGAILNAKIKKIVYGAKRETNLIFNHYKVLDVIYKSNDIKILNGICEKECRLLLKSFFKRLR